MKMLVRACIEFSAAHRIAGHPRCGRVHGHNYRVCVWLRESKPMEVDLDDLAGWLEREVYNRLDHTYLNDVFGRETVTSEDLAQWVWEVLEKAFKGRVERVEVCETGSLCVELEGVG
jgi:6-pyruvoyltetrahydropterin/6-carboxytetrahydropterin synthase